MAGGAWAQSTNPNNYKANDTFEPLGTALPTPNVYRTASGAPGKAYWQQRADYDIKAELDDENQRIIGSETITFFNNSPDDLPYLWLQLDQNLFKNDAIGGLSRTGTIDTKGMSLSQIQAMNAGRGSTLDPKTQYGYNITAVKDKAGKPLPHTIVGTMMRIDLPAPMKPATNMVFSIDWDYNITEYYGRSGYEFYEKDGNYNYFIAHWFPRMAPYDDVNGWNHKQFLGQGEFSLIFGNYKVALTVPNDHIVAASGECQNYNQVLSGDQKKRMRDAENATTPVIIVTQEEAIQAEKGKPTGKKTWIYKADNVRDFAFASSRKFIWDAMKTDVYGNGRKIWSMSYYPKEGNPLWEQYSTRAVEHTLRSYGKRTFEYPYPVAISCHATRGGGMEYPMISFNGGRPEEDGTYSEGTKYGMIGVIIHEVGPQLLPDDCQLRRAQLDLMDEGLNTFCQYLAEKEWDYNYPTRRGEAQSVTEYMASDKAVLSPIMAQSDNVIGLGPNAYAKPAAGLNILRETIMGRELFDYAFKEYATRWMFKSPTPADFFRTMEDASGVDLDWFWKGWFYGVQPVDQALVSVGLVQRGYAESRNREGTGPPGRRPPQEHHQQAARRPHQRPDRGGAGFVDGRFLQPLRPIQGHAARPQEIRGLPRQPVARRPRIGAVEHEFLHPDRQESRWPGDARNRADGVRGRHRLRRPLPRRNLALQQRKRQQGYLDQEKVVQWTLDPYQEIADIDQSDNSFPPVAKPTRFQIYKQREFQRPANPMQMEQRSGGAGRLGTGNK